jgi:hypothetical protein
MEALKRSLSAKGAARANAQPAGRSGSSDRRLEKVVSFADFKSALAASGLKPNEQSLRKSYQALDMLRKARNLSWTDVQKKLDQFHEGFQASGSGVRRLRAARIPLTERDWERIGSA